METERSWLVPQSTLDQSPSRPGRTICPTPSDLVCNFRTLHTDLERAIVTRRQSRESTGSRIFLARRTAGSLGGGPVIGRSQRKQYKPYRRHRAIEGAVGAGIEVSTYRHEPSRPHVHYPPPLVFLRRESSLPSPQRMFRLRVGRRGRICDTSVPLNIPEHLKRIFDSPLTSSRDVPCCRTLDVADGGSETARVRPCQSARRCFMSAFGEWMVLQHRRP
ncbi:hypothetical protein L226DRAFT_33191 [Lentinus tigrinus ALCF2SS1-7]|uniref:uncharacterized protein n=1 Tax=Lentinus tigrinus ALCF2SS1-7 TaxID=1328758 RepID=UPI001165CFCF|nr:hypothetical protein L226DRAFT_33191 [Lentinus tigrinus ALCF2SS1-7]